MSEHLSNEMITALRDGRVPRGEIRASLRHIAECGRCRELAGAGDEAELVFSALDQPDDERHLDADEELFPFVDGTADEATRELVLSHVETCGMCRRELEDLRALHAETQRGHTGRLRKLALVAGIILVTGALGVWFAVRPKPEPLPVPPPIVEQTPAPQPVRDKREERWKQLVDASLARGSLPVSSVVATIALPQHTLRGEGEGDRAALTPMGVVIESRRPRFSWKDGRGATYVVTVYEGENEIANSGAIDRPQWQPLAPLRRGRAYLWQVRVQRGDEVSILPSPPAPQALFHILDDAAVSELAAARAAHPDDHLLLAVLSANHGLVDDAKRHLAHLRNDPNSTVRRLAERELAR